MARLTTCTSCQMGDHAHHHEVVQAVPEGMVGGSVCTCRGECSDGRYEPKEISRLADLFACAIARAK